MPPPVAVRGWAVVAIGLLGAAAACGQTPAAITPPGAAVEKALAADRPGFFAGSAGPYAVTDHDEPLMPRAGWDHLPGAAPDWFGAITVGVARPHLSGERAGGPGLPFAALDGTVLPRVEIGYRLPDGAGDLRLGYHLVAASGSDSSVPGVLNTRLDVNSLDLDYVSGEWLVEPTPDLCRGLRALAGVRLADATVKSTGPFGDFRSEFAGAGPRFGLEWRRPLPMAWPVEAYVRAEGTGLAGQTRQTIGFAAAGPWQWNGAAAMLAEFGVGWQPTDGFRVVVGYQLERWWNLGRTDAADVDLTVHAVFLRGEWRY